MKRCGLYTRVSTEDQAQVKDGSLETQMDLLERHVQLKADSTDESWRVAGRYREEGRSGKDMNRPEFQHLLADVRAGRIDVIPQDLPAILEPLLRPPLRLLLRPGRDLLAL